MNATGVNGAGLSEAGIGGTLTLTLNITFQSPAGILRESVGLEEDAGWGSGRQAVGGRIFRIAR